MPKSDKNAIAFLRLILRNEVPASSVYTALGTGLAGAGTPGNVYVSLHSAYPGIAGAQTASEVTWSGATPYARVPVARATGSWNDPAVVSGTVSTSNVGAITFPQKQDTGTVDVKFLGVGTDGSGAGHMLWVSPLALAQSLPFTVTDISAPSDYTCIGHGFSNGDTVCLLDVDGATLPSGPSEGSFYVVANVTTNTFQLTSGDATAVGAGRVAKVLGQTISQNTIPEFAAGKLVIVER